MNKEQVELFNHNVYIDNHNTALLENATRTNRNAINYMFQFIQESDFWYSILLFILVLYVFLVHIRMNNFEERLNDLEEERRPELEPLLPAKVTKV